MIRRSLLLLPLLLGVAAGAQAEPTPDVNGLIVIETDFGTKDGAVSVMKGVALGVSRDLQVYDLTQQIEPFDIWQGAYELAITLPFWPEGTVFVAVIDPGVGTERDAVVAKLKSGHFVVGPDNGLLTLVAENQGVAEVRSIDQTKHRLPGSEKSFTFHGRDVFAYAAAKLASGQISFEEVGPVLKGDVVRLAYMKPMLADGVLTAMIPSLDRNFGNVWTNIDRKSFEQLGIAKGGEVAVTILHGGETIWSGAMPYVDTFGDVGKGEALLYFNSEDAVSFAINYGDFAAEHGVSAGPDWRVQLSSP